MADVDDAAAKLTKLLTDFVVKNKDTMSRIQACVHNLRGDHQLIIKKIKAITDDSGRTAVHKAAAANQDGILFSLLSQLDVHERYGLLRTTDNHGNTPIHGAAKNVGDKTLTEMLEQQPFENKVQLLQMQNKKGDTAIHDAAIAGHRPSMKTMLKKVSQETINELLKIRNEQGDTAVLGGIRKGNKEIVTYMLESVAAVDRVNLLRIQNVQGNALHCAALADCVMPYWLIESNDQLFNLMEEENDSGQTPMHCAMSQGHANVVIAMLAIANDFGGIAKQMKLLQNQDGNGNSPLHCAAVAGHTRALKQVLRIFGMGDNRERLLAIENHRSETVVQTATAARDRLNEWLQKVNN